MVDPLIALLSGIGVLASLALIFWPESGLFWRFQRRGILTEKVLIEDTLKYIFKCERNQHDGYVIPIALGILVCFFFYQSRGRAVWAYCSAP